MIDETDRARRHTSPSSLRRIDDESVHHLMRGIEEPETLSPRLAQLDAEWDLDRAVEMEAALTGLLGLALGVFLKSRLLMLPAAIGAGVLAFGAVGVHPLLPLFRRVGLRTAREVQRERYGLKALRGDFAPATKSDTSGAQAPLH